MPITGKKEQVLEEEIQKDAFVVTFTNGALEQLEDFKKVFNETDLTEVVKLGISFLQQVKEVKQREQKKEVASE